MNRLRLLFIGLALAVLCAGCATVVEDAERMSQAGQNDDALALLDHARRNEPGDPQVRAAWLRQRELVITQLANRFEADRSAGRLDDARATLDRLQALDAQHPRTVTAREEFKRDEREKTWLAQAQAAQAKGRNDEAEALLRRVLTESPGQPAARAALLKLADKRPPPDIVPALGTEFRKIVSLEFRDASLRSVFESLGRTNGLNFVFDKDVRTDTKISVMLHSVSVADALRVILTTQQLERKVLNDRTLLIYPNTLAKQREHEDLVTRSFYLVNTDVKQAQAMVRALAKTRDVFIDERLNLMVIRDSPQVVRLVERLLASLDLPEPEVMLDVEVIEISSAKLDALGVKWPDTISYGLGGGASEVTRADRGNLLASIANPALVATLRETASRGNVLAHPRLRARNHEKAKILIGEKLPVFASTAATANVAGTTSVSYLDVGLKLEVEPSVQLDNDTVIKVGLEVSTLIAQVIGPAGSIGYDVGTRQASTSLRLRDGETQVLGGLVRDEDTKSISGIPGLASLPLVGRLFGVHGDGKNKTEIILLITPHVLRNIGLPESDAILGPGGLEANPGAEPLRLASHAAVAMPPTDGAMPRPALPSAAPAPDAASSDSSGETAPGALIVATSGEAKVGGTASVTLQNTSGATVSAEVVVDPRFLALPNPLGRSSGRMPFSLAPGGQRAVVMSVLDPAGGQAIEVGIDSLTATQPDGTVVPVPLRGERTLRIAPK
ncbi:MAG: general secretion pathway protein GspD [Burkholderiales bacterium]|nr:general secretion pathway protein GspD [Burkholderiales bacterium]